MTITRDVVTEDVRTGTTSPHTFSHVGAASGINGVVLALVHGVSSTDHVSAASYGGVAMTRKQRNVDTATELGAAEIWFLGSGIPQGTQTVSYTPGATTDDFHAVCITLLAARDTETIDNDGISENVANPSVTLQYNGREAMAFAALYGGGADGTAFTPNANCTTLHDHDLGAFYSEIIAQTTAGTADFAIGGTSGTDDVAFAAIAVAEIGVMVGTRWVGLDQRPSQKQRGFIDVIPNLLATTLFVAPLPFIAQSMIEGQAYPSKWVEPPPSLNLTLLKASTNQLRAPVFTNPSKVAKPFLDPAPNRLGTLLTVSQAPLAQDHTIEGKRYRVYFDTQPQQNLLATTLGSVPLPFANDSWSETRRRVPGGFDQAVNLQASTLAPAAQAPFSQTDWSGVRKTLRGDELVQNTLALGTVPAAPIRNFDWTGYKKPSFGTIIHPPRVIGVGIVPQPFVNTDWCGIRHKPSKGTIFYAGRLSGTGVVAPPVVERPFVNPDFADRGKKSPLRVADQPPNLLVTTLYICGMMPDVWPEPTRRKTKGFLQADENRLVRYLFAAPTIQPKPRAEWPQPSRKAKPFLTEYYNVIPLQVGPAPSPFVGASFPEGMRRKRNIEVLQTPYPLSALFLQGETPFLNHNWDGRSSVKRVGLESEPTNLLLLGVDSGRPLLSNLPEEQPKRFDQGRQIEQLLLGSPHILLHTESMPFLNFDWQDGHGRDELKWQQVLSAEEYNLTVLLPIGPTPPEPPDPPTASPPKTEAMEEYHVSRVLIDPAAQEELQRVEQVLQQFDTKGLRVSHLDPAKPVDGQTQIADGINWNPLGDGVKEPVWYDSATLTWKRFIPQGTLGSGTYTPILFGVTNVASATAEECYYIRVGRVMQVSGRVNVQPAATGTTRLGISLPIGSALTSSAQLAGVGAALSDTESTNIVGDAVNNRAEMTWVALSTTSQGFSFTFTARILA